MPLYQVDVDGQTVEFDSPVDLTPEQLEAEVSGFRSQIAPPAAPEEAPGYISQLGTSLYQSGRQALGGARTAFNALTGDTADMAASLQQQAEAQRALQEAQTPEDVAFLEDLNKQAEELKQARGFLPTLSEAIDLPMAALRQPGAAIKTAVQSLPNALISTPITLGAGLVGTAAGGLVGLPTTGPGAVATGIAGGIAAGTAANTALEAGSEIYQRFVERIGDPAGMTREQIAAALDQNPDIASEGLTTGLTRGAVIGTIETLGLKGAGALLAAPERAAIQATRQVLTRSGVDLADDAAVRAAMATPEMAKATKAAADAARAGFNMPARAAGAGAIEIGASGVGEALAQQAVGQETDYADVFLEMLGEGVAAAPSVLAARGVELAGTGIQAVRERVSEQVADNAKADARLDIDDLINNAGENAAIQVNQAVDDAAKVVPAGQPTVEGEMPIEVMPPVTSPTPETQKTSQGTGVIYSPLPAPRPTSALASAGLESDVDLGPIPPEGRTFTSADFGTRGLVMGGASESQLEAMLLSAIKSGREVTLIKEGKPRRMGIRDGNRLVDSDGNRWFPLGALSGGGEFVVGPATAPAPATVSEPTPITPQSLPTGQAQAPAPGAATQTQPTLPNAPEIRQIPEGGQLQRQDVDEGGPTAEAGGGNRPVQGGQVQAQEVTAEPVQPVEAAPALGELPAPQAEVVSPEGVTPPQPLPPTGGVPTESLPAGQPTSGDVGTALRIVIPEGATQFRTDSLMAALQSIPEAEARPFLAHGTDSPDAVESLVRVGPRTDTEYFEGSLMPSGDGNPWGNTKTSSRYVLVSKPGGSTSTPEGIGAVVVNQTDRNEPRSLPVLRDMEQRLAGTGVAVLTPSEIQSWIQSAQPTSGDVGTALRAVATNTATPEQVASLEAQGLARTVQGQPVITDAGLALMPEAERPRLTEAERVAEIEGQGGIMASLRDVWRNARTQAVQTARQALESTQGRFVKYDGSSVIIAPSGKPGVIMQVTYFDPQGNPTSDATLSETDDIEGFIDGMVDEVAEYTLRQDLAQAFALGGINPVFPDRQAPVAYQYRLKYRDVGPASQPEGFISSSGRSVEYDRPLTEQELSDFEIEPVGARLINAAPTNTPPANVQPSIRPLQGDQQRNETMARRRRGKAQVPASLRDRDGPPLPNIKVNANDGARAREIEDKQVPGAKDTWIGTAAEYLAEFPDQTAVNDRRVEAFYDAATDRAVILIDRVVARDGDAIRAARNGTSAAVEAVRRLIRHESFVHRGWRALPQNLKTEFLGIAESLVPEEEIEAIVAKGYSRYAGWRTDPSVRAMVVEEWLAQRLETLEKLPATDGGPLSRLIDWAKRVWQWLNGNDAVEPTRAELVDVMRQMIRALEIGEKSREVAEPIRPSFIGEKAEMSQFMRDSLETARSMAAAGKSSEEIRAVTGWFQGLYDGKMRWELPDNEAAFVDADTFKNAAVATYGGQVFNRLPIQTIVDRVKSGNYVKLSDVFSHPALFAAYPDAANIPFFPIGGNVVQGSHRVVDGNSVITATVLLDESGQISEESTSTILHELQHYIQNREGFAKGGSPDNLITRSDLMDALKFRPSYEELLKYRGSIAYFVKELAKEKAKTGFLGFGGPSRKAIKSIEDSITQIQESVNSLWESLDKNMSVSRDSTRAALLAAIVRVEAELGGAWVLQNRNEGLNRIYKLLAGEIEARDVQARRTMTPEQRAATAPYSSENIAPEDAIVLFDGREQGVMASLTDTDAAYMDALQGDNGNDNLTEQLRAATEADRQGVLNDWIARNPQSAATLQQRVDEAAKKAGYGQNQYSKNDFDTWAKTIGELDQIERIAINNSISAEQALKNTNISPVLRKVAQSSLERNKKKAQEIQDKKQKGPSPKRLVRGDSRADITVYRGVAGRSIWATDSEQVAKTYGDNVRSFFLEMKNPLVVDADGRSFKELSFEDSKLDADDLSDIAKERGYDGLIIRNFYDSNTADGGDVIADHFTIFNPSQIKSADPVTYDDAGNVIPLSQRFQPESPDIRFSLTDTDAAYMDAVARGDMETAQRLVDNAWWGGGSKTPHVLLFSKGRYRAFPASYIRLGVPPKGPSGIFQGDKRVGDEKGVSVYAAWKDPKTGTFVIPSAVALDEFGDMDRKIYEVRGSSLRDTGSDDEVLLDPVSVEVVDEVDGLSVVTSSVPYLSLRGEALPENKIPDWKSSEAFALNDTVTYDDAGNVIPLSQRFQPESPDIRFSLTDPTASNIIQDANQTTTEQQPTRSRPLSPETAPGRATEVLPTGEEIVERTQIDKTSMPRLEALAIKFVDSLGPVDTWPNKILNTAWWRANGGNMRDDFGQMVMAEALYRTGIGALQGNPTLVEVNDLISREYQTGATQAAKALASRSYVTTSERYGPMFAVQGMVDQRRRQQETVIDANVDVAAGVDAVNNADAQAQSDASAELDEELRLKDAIYELGLAARTPEIQTRIRRINDNVFRLGVLAQIREQLLSRVQASFVGLSRAAVEQQYASLSVEQIDAEIARLEREVADDVAAVESERQRVRAAPKPKGAAADPITQARTIIARLEADPKTKKTPKANPVRDLYREHLKNPMAEDEFMTRMAGIGVPAAEAQKLYDLAAVKIAATEAVKAQREAEDEAKKLSDAERFAERVINDAAERFADPPIEENGRKDLPNKRKSLSIRDLFNFHVQNGMTLEAFIPAAAQVGLDEATARRLHGAGLLVRDARQSIKTARTEARLDDMAASEAGRLIYETSKLHRQSGYINTPSQAADTIRNVFMEQVKSPVSFEQFAQRLKGLRVDEDLAIRLFNVASRETAARQAMVEERKRQTSIRREIKLGDMAAKEAGRLIYETSKLHRQSGYINTTSPAADTIRKAFMDQVKDPKPFEQFVERLKALRVEEDLATRLFNVADREHTARKAVAYGRRLIERRERLLDAKGSALENLINKLRGKITGDLSWREMFDRPLETQRQWRRDLFAALRNDPALAGLTPQEIGDLVVEIDKVWEAKRKKNFEAQLKRMNLPGAKGNSKDKIVKSAPKLLRYINAGFFNDAAFRNAISEEFGIPALNEETVKQVVDLMQRAQADGITEVERKGLMLEAIRLMQRDLKAELGDILSNYWVTSVLSGFATQFDMAFSALNGMRVMAQSMADLAIRKREFKLAGRAGMAYLRALGNAILEAARYFYTGDPKLLDNYQYTLNTYLTEGSAAANPFDYFERIIKDPNRPSWKKIMPYFYAGMQRAMTAFDHINSTATTQGMLEMAMFYNRELYEGARMPSKEDVAAARAKAVEMAGGDKTWGQKREVSSYTRQILNELLNKKYPGLLDEARDIGKVVSYTNDPTGIGGIVYHTLLGVTNKYINEAGKYRDEVRAQQEAASRTKRFMANLNYIAAANARNMTGLRFVRFVGNRLNEILSFTPGFGFLRLQEKGMTPTMRAMIIQNQTLGLSLSVLAGVTILRALTDEEDDEKRGFRISGSWSSLPPDKKNQLRASGRSPYAIELWDGKKWISFNYNAWPVASIIATAGNLNDQRLFNPEKWEEKDFEDKLLSAAWAGAFSFKDLSALSGFMDMIGKSAYSTDPVEGATQWIAKFSTNYVGGFVPRMLKDIDLIMDPETRKARDFGAYIAKEFPFFRRTEAAGEKLYNIFGEPVKLNRMPWRRAVTATREEPEYETLAELNRRGIFLGAANPSNRTVGSGATRRELTDAEAEKYMVETGKLYRDFIKQQGQSLLQLDRAQAEEVISKTTERLRAAALRMSIGATK